MTGHSRDALNIFPPTKNEDTARSQSKEDHVDGDNVVENAFIGAEQGDYDREQALQSNGHDRRSCSRMNGADAFEKQTVLGHREVNAWRGEHALAQKACSRDRNARRNGARAKISQGAA